MGASQARDFQHLTSTPVGAESPCPNANPNPSTGLTRKLPESADELEPVHPGAGREEIHPELKDFSAAVWWTLTVDRHRDRIGDGRPFPCNPVSWHDPRTGSSWLWRRP